MNSIKISTLVIFTGWIIRKRKVIIFISGLLIGLVCYTETFAQSDPILEDSNIRPFTASGSIGVSASAYSASGIQMRRAPASLQTTANMNFSLFGLSSGLNLLYSTDQSRFRQNMNNMSFNASWRWLTIQSGDVSPNFSEYGINGATIRGGYIKVNPGYWQVELSGGRSMRRVESIPAEGLRMPSFERWSIAGKIGYGSENSNHIHLSTHYSLDKSKSLETPGDITPQENLTISPDAEVTLFKGKLSLATQFTLSAYTRDLNSPVIPARSIGGVTSFLTGVMTAHTSSRINYAGNASANLDLNNFGLELGFERIQPGFYSLGVGRVRDDQQQIRISPSLQLFNNKLSLQSSVVVGRDNLLGTRLQTQRNTTVGTNAQLQLTDMISISGNYNLLVNNVSSNFDADTTVQGVALDQKQLSHTLMLQPTVTFQTDGRTHSISLSASYFSLTNEFTGVGPSLPEGIESDAYTSALAYSLTFPSGFAVNTMGNFLASQSGNSRNISMGGNMGASYSFFERKLTLSLNGGVNQNMNKITPDGQTQNAVVVEARQVMLNLITSYRLTEKDSFSLTVRNRTNSIIRGGGNTFSELEGSFNYQHRF